MNEGLTRVTAAIARDGFAMIPSGAVSALLPAGSPHLWDAFADSWNQLGADTYMADGGRYRRRRHAAFSLSVDGIERKPHQPHYQSRDYNPLNGGIERWFAPITDEIAAHPVLTGLLRTAATLFIPLTPPETRPTAWHTEVHQIRIETQRNAPGLPTPEGSHQDGVDWVLVVLIRRHNVMDGTTTIHDPAGTVLGSFTLASPLDAAAVDDSRVLHGVTPIVPLDPALPGYRDVLIVTLRRA